MLRTWIAERDGFETQMFVFNPFNDVEFSYAINWRFRLTTNGYNVRTKL